MVPKDYRRILAVGDIHGMYDKLDKLLKEIRFNPLEDLLVFLGDYIDRGPDSLRCLDRVMSVEKFYPGRVVCLKGNHEDMAVKALSAYRLGLNTLQDDIMVWINNGGYATFCSMETLAVTELNKYYRWMKNLRVKFTVGNFYFCHAGIRPGIALSKQKKDDLFWIRDSFFDGYKGDKVIVVGHTKTFSWWLAPYLPEGADNRLPQFLDNNIIACDTGAYNVNGRLSCVDVLSKRFWQV